MPGGTAFRFRVTEPEIWHVQWNRSSRRDGRFREKCAITLAELYKNLPEIGALYRRFICLEQLSLLGKVNFERT